MPRDHRRSSVLDSHSDLVGRIEALKRERRAVILAHNYQRPEVQDVADFVGDSLELARSAAGTTASRIIFCGVGFMAQTAAILCPGKEVYIPDPNAGCPLANMISPRELAALKALHPDAAVVTYVNSSAEIKAMSDVCCTSSNSVAVAKSFPPSRRIIFTPDKNLGRYTARESGRELILWPGYCPTHAVILPRDVEEARRAHPAAKLVAHPECGEAVCDAADRVASTSGILRYCGETDAPEFIIGTEIGILHRLGKENPGKRFYAASLLADCPNMKLITLEKVLWALEDLVQRVEVPEAVARGARVAVERMVEIGK